MLKRSYLTAFLLILSSYLYAQNWVTDFELAKKMALAENKLMLLDFTASWCGPCKYMEINTWSKENVKKEMAFYESVKIDLDSNKDLARFYGVSAIPNILIVDPNGIVLEQIRGYRDANFMQKFLHEKVLDLAFVQKELISFFKKRSYSSALRLANKYQIYAMLLKKDKVRVSLLLSVANNYFKIAKKIVKKSKSKNKEGLLQKIDLYELRKSLILNKNKQVAKKLSKLKESEIDNMNKSLYASLNYVVLTNLKDLENAKKWFDNMNDSDKAFAKRMLNKD